jgi:hypothetical protein
VDAAKAQDIEAGDGTTTVAVMAGALCTAASDLLARGSLIWNQFKLCFSLLDVRNQFMRSCCVFSAFFILRCSRSSCILFVSRLFSACVRDASNESVHVSAAVLAPSPMHS